MPLSEDGSVGEHSHANDLYYNPFATPSQVSFTSAIKPKDGRVETRPGFRRRGSESVAQRHRTDHDPWDDDPTPSTRAHGRASTSDGLASSSSASKVHPLASPGRVPSGSSSRMSLIDTRPHLRRVVSDLESESNERRRSHSPDGLVSPNQRAAADMETMVIVHEVRCTEYNVLLSFQAQNSISCMLGYPKGFSRWSSAQIRYIHGGAAQSESAVAV